MDITCPNCGHDGTVRAALAYGDGTSEHRFFAFAGNLSLAQMFGGVLLVLALWWLVLPLLFFGGGVTAILGKGRSTTLIASANRPPGRISPWIIYLGGATTILFLPMLLASEGIVRPLGAYGQWMYLVAPIASIALVIHLGRKMLQYNRTTWPEQEAIWQRTFMCKRCGTRFIKSDFDPVGVNVVRSDRPHQDGLLPNRFEDDEVAAARRKARTDDGMLRKRRI